MSSQWYVKVVKWLPFYQRWRAPLLRKLRRSPLLREVLARLGFSRARLARGAASAGSPPLMGLAAGRSLVGQDLDRVPVSVIVCLGWDTDAMEQLAAQIEEAQVLTGGFRPVLMIDTPVFGPLLQRGWPVEHFMSRAAWNEFFDPADWTGYYLQRIAAVADTYQAVSVVPLAPSLDEPVRRDLLYAASSSVTGR